MDTSLHDTYYVVTHFHIILSLGAGISVIIGLYYLADHLLATQLSPMYRVVWITSTSSISWYLYGIQFNGILCTFTTLHLIGFSTMPRRILDYTDQLITWNYISSIGSGITLISLLIMVRL
jgi:heme/copper-type cytochrome/quinol oxidase subunit 1